MKIRTIFSLLLSSACLLVYVRAADPDSSPFSFLRFGNAPIR